MLAREGVFFNHVRPLSTRSAIQYYILDLSLRSGGADIKGTETPYNYTNVYTYP